MVTSILAIGVKSGHHPFLLRLSNLSIQERMRDHFGHGGFVVRYEKADNLVQLALELQAARGGLSLADIEHKFGVGRRTAMRMRDAAIRNFPQMEEVDTGERIKRWRLPTGTLDRLVAFTAEELAALESATRLFERDNREDEAAELATLGAKLRALLKPDVARRVEPDLEALLEAEGLAMRPGPRPRIDISVVEELRQAIMACTKVKLRYRNRKTKQVNERLVHPYGFLHGHRNYLVAWHENPKANAVTLFALPHIEGIELTAEPFQRDPEFSLEAFATRSFGLFQSEPFKTVWRFSPEAADDAEEFIFHPTQQVERQSDGSLLVTIMAASDLEMAWHLYTWGDKVEVLEPRELAEMVHGQRVEWAALP
ncbi:transcriptional regulator [Paramagnetospirillum caucaseum]|uniref:Transcriptional regulator n=1 Tax=Paramagnetospirillum caucaseum TaxID=1244869 RepID=M2Z0T3_9PROT|nr:WYL domain-containing protein [Paramagnetospirillum caucaseum]EME67890.1 transcriptional regulator [Paramagnetospirillum caucaseum]